jgi:selenocysteine lyase/cysteine desulfurase
MRKSGGTDFPAVRSSSGHTRRRFLSAVGVGSIAGVTRAPSALRADDIHQAPSSAGAPEPSVRSEYLLAPGLTYLNTASLGPTSRAVLDRTLETWRELESNPVAMAYGEGPVQAAADRARALMASVLNCTADEILITRSTTDAMNSLAQGIRLNSGDRVLTTDQEHDGGSVGWRYRSRRDGVHIDVVPIAPTDHDPAAILQRFADAITPKTRVISVSHVITSTGLRMPIAEIARLAKSRGVFSIVDGAQAVGQIDVDVRALGCDAYATAGHKWLMGPKGTGILYVSREAAGIEPVQWADGRTFIAHSTGVGSQPLAAGLAAAIEALRGRGLLAVERHNLALRNRVYAGLSAIPQLQVVSPPPGPLGTALVAARLPPHIDSKHVRDVLREKHGIMVKMIEKQWFNGIRLSPHIFNTDADVDAALRAIRAEVA